MFYLVSGSDPEIQNPFGITSLRKTQMPCNMVIHVFGLARNDMFISIQYKSGYNRFHRQFLSYSNVATATCLLKQSEHTVSLEPRISRSSLTALSRDSLNGASHFRHRVCGRLKSFRCRRIVSRITRPPSHLQKTAGRRL